MLFLFFVLKETIHIGKGKEAVTNLHICRQSISFADLHGNLTQVGYSWLRPSSSFALVAFVP